MPPTTASQVAQLPVPAAVAAIRIGLPAKAFDDVAHILSLTYPELAKVLDIPERTIRDQLKRRVRLSSENTEKLVRAARVHALARKVFTTDEAVAEWLDSPAPALNGVKPLALLDTDIGARDVESVLQGIAYGNVM